MYTERLRKLYALMLRARMLAEQAQALPGKLRRAQLEACEVGVGYHLTSDDIVAPSSRDFMLDLVRDSKLSNVLEHINARVELNRGRKAAQPELNSSITVPADAPAQLAIATGMAAACRVQNRPDITVAMCAFDEKMSAFPSHALRFAAENRLGIIYVLCTAWNSRLSLREAALACDVPGIIVDGKDVVAVYRVAEESVRRARQRMGPTLIDCRLEPGRDPIKFMEEYLRKRNLWSPEWKREILEGYMREFAQLREPRQSA